MVWRGWRYTILSCEKDHIPNIKSIQTTDVFLEVTKAWRIFSNETKRYVGAKQNGFNQNVYCEEEGSYMHNNS